MQFWLDHGGVCTGRLTVGGKRAFEVVHLEVFESMMVVLLQETKVEARHFRA